MIWINEALRLPAPVDTILFDVDGVLIDDAPSYYATIRAAVRHIVTERHTRPAETSRVELSDILAFKAAGRFNDDWTLTYALCGILLAAPAHQQPDLPAIAAASAGRGLPWVQEAYFPDLSLDRKLLTRICWEMFWGEALFEKHFGEPARFVQHAGFVHEECALVPPDYLETLRHAGARRFGIITGRNYIELEAGMGTLGYSPAAFGSILTLDEISKPDPQAMVRSMQALQPGRALYIGDTADDLKLVLNYRELGVPLPACLAVMVARPGQRDSFLQQADVLLNEASELPEALGRLGTGR